MDMNVNNTLSCLALPAAFEFTEGTVRAFQIAFTQARDDDDIVDSRL